MARARRLRRACVEGRDFTVRSLKKVILLEKLFTVIMIVLFNIVMGYCCITMLDRDVTAMVVIVLISLVLIFDKTYRFPILKAFYNIVDALKDQEVWNDKYDDYERYYDYDVHVDEEDGLY